MDGLDGRHPSTLAVARWFEYDHLRPGKVQGVSAQFASLAQRLVTQLPDSPELTVCLRKLLEAKDCAVRAAVAEEGI